MSLTDNDKLARQDWDFVHDQNSTAQWRDGLREIFDYRDLGIADATNGDYIAHIIRANGKTSSSDVQQWHVHDCTFQFVQVLEGWATFEYDGQGEKTIRKGDTVLQPPGIKHREIACSKDFSVLEIVAPANFETRVVDAPAARKT